MDWNFVLTILKGLGTGFLVSLVGYIKNLPEGETLDWKKAGSTLIIGLIAGAVAAWQNVDINTAMELIAAFGIISFVNSFWSYLVKEKIKRFATKKKKKR